MRRTRSGLLATLLAGIVSVAIAGPNQPTGSPDGTGQVATVTDRGVTTIYVSGQPGSGDDYRMQVESAFSQVIRQLAQVGASRRDIVKLRAFVTDLSPGRYRTVADIGRETFPAGSWPAATIVGAQTVPEGVQIIVEAVAVVAEPGAELRVDRIAPADGASAAVAVTAHKLRTIYLSGQVGEGGGLAVQAASVWNRIGQRLDEAGAAYADLVNTTSYIKDLDPATYYELYREGIPPAVEALEGLPASTVVGVPSLGGERLVVVVDAVAVVGVDGAPVERVFIDPTNSFTHIVTTRGSGPRTIHMSAQAGRPGDPLALQVDQAYAAVARRLNRAGATPDDSVRLTLYVPGYADDDRPVLEAAAQRHGFTARSGVAMMQVGIQSLYAPEALVAVEALAVVSP